ncbi:unnamed protein product [Schistosoma mattheei]|uniref:Uncharacterized protein n=1 Tax=Schistosoma mattheei TaxID=31246 RepID=A0AA85C245_9TREM|nr:unnamed protein product [Schistosoma mattheei]
MLFVLFFLYTIVDEISSAFASSSSPSTSSLSSLSNNNHDHHNNNLILATGSACPSNPGIACSHDYLSVDARISNVYDDSSKLYPPDESYLVGQIYGPISNVYGLQFTSNLNLLDPYIIHGKGIVLEYIGKH